MSFFAPDRLWLLAAVTALAGLYVVTLLRNRKRYGVRFSNLALLDRVAPRGPGWRRHLPAAVFLVMLSLLVLAFARPAANAKVPRERATVLIALDVSNSMAARDVEPSRLDAAKSAALAFVDRLPARFNVGLVAFDGSAAVVVAPTRDHQSVDNGIRGLALGPATAIGEAVFASLEAIANFDEQAGTNPPPSRIVLLSDGANTAGRSPERAAEAARAAHIAVSTIAYGTPEGTVEVNGQLIPVPVDGPALERLAKTSDGAYYEAASGEELQKVYQDIGSSVGYRTIRREISVWFIGFGLLAAFSAAVASLVWTSRLP
ncbi:MAG TPA: VWA domain-containing protein [Actinomycetes bacterium]|nr:VWA domain-containing protein [Actinomycetes bacterium]